MEGSLINKTNNSRITGAVLEGRLPRIANEHFTVEVSIAKERVPTDFLLRSWPVLACVLCLVMMACVRVPAVNAQDGLSAQQVTQICQLSDATLTKEGLPGLSIAVAKDGQVWSAGFGSADLEQNVAVDSRTLFRTASISKWMTATAAMRLAEEGKLNVDAPIQQYCPQYPAKQWGPLPLVN
jgi:CubicO group peptidase (beta-lactamase class C family)